jgi:hypothetical protein
MFEIFLKMAHSNLYPILHLSLHLAQFLTHALIQSQDGKLGLAIGKESLQLDLLGQIHLSQLMMLTFGPITHGALRQLILVYQKCTELDQYGVMQL